MIVSESIRVVFQLTGTNLDESMDDSHGFRALISPREAKYGIQVVPSWRTSGASFPEERVVEMRFQASPQSKTTTLVLIPVRFVKRLSLCSSFSCGDAPFGIIQTVNGSCLGSCFATGAFAAKRDETAIAVTMLTILVIAFIVHLLIPKRSMYRQFMCIIFVDLLKK